jgi:hypothetical protein
MMSNQTTTNTKTVNTTTRCYMAVNVILTFDDYNEWGDSQEFFDLKLPVSAHEKNAEDFIDNKLFKRIFSFCQRWSRDPQQLVKISTASDWAVFEAKTGKPSLPSLGHRCKWHFGKGRLDLDIWEQNLMQEFGFGTAVDMSWVNERDSDVVRALFMDRLIQRDSQQLGAQPAGNR